MRRKRVGGTIAILAAALALIGGVYAYLTGSDDQQNTLLLGDNEIEVVENFDDETEVKLGENSFDKKVQVKNTGNVDCYMRVYVGFTDHYAQLASGLGVIPEGSSEPEVYYSAVFEPGTEIKTETGTGVVILPDLDVDETSSADQETYWAAVDDAEDRNLQAAPDDLGDYVNEDLYINHLPDGWVYVPEEIHSTNTGVSIGGSLNSIDDISNLPLTEDSSVDDSTEDSSADDSTEDSSADDIAQSVKIAMGGWFYYTKPVAPGELTPSLFDKVFTYYVDESQVKPYDIIVYAESVQTKGIDGNLIEDGVDADGNVIPAWKAAWTDFLTRAYDKQIESYTVASGDSSAASDSGDAVDDSSASGDESSSGDSTDETGDSSASGDS